MESLEALGASPGFPLAVSEAEETGKTTAAPRKEWADAPLRVVKRRREDARKTTIISLAGLLSLTAVVYLLLRCAELLSPQHESATESLRLLASRRGDEKCSKNFGSIRSSSSLGARLAHHRSFSTLLQPRDPPIPDQEYHPPFYDFPTIFDPEARRGLKKFMRGLGSLRHPHRGRKSKTVRFYMDGVSVTLEFFEQALEAVGKHMETAFWRKPSTSREEFTLRQKGWDDSSSGTVICVTCSWNGHSLTPGSTPLSPFEEETEDNEENEGERRVFTFPETTGDSAQASGAAPNDSSSDEERQGLPPPLPKGSPVGPPLATDHVSDGEKGQSMQRADSTDSTAPTAPAPGRLSAHGEGQQQARASSWQTDMRRRGLALGSSEESWLEVIEESESDEGEHAAAENKQQQTAKLRPMKSMSSLDDPKAAPAAEESESVVPPHGKHSHRKLKKKLMKRPFSAWLKGRRASLAFEFPRVEDGPSIERPVFDSDALRSLWAVQQAKEGLQAILKEALQLCYPSKSLRSRSVKFKVDGIEVEVTFRELIQFGWRPFRLVNECGIELEAAFIDAMLQVESYSLGKSNTVAGAADVFAVEAQQFKRHADFLHEGD
ncbi:hypothetical protein, conserved [Eimeria praecox]|uniref:Uncharacterized protein n=1 Tax=Eimeria praecox TaxID=51316 RepID=U6G2L5_9EIME|nr:hypothetical protein, conserved [Eimeria praecox]